MNYDTQHVPVKTLHPAAKTLEVHPPFEADGRDSLLLASVREVGIIEPLKIKADGTIEDGYRRSECARFLKIEMVPVMILPDGLEIFEHMQTARQLSLYAVCKIYRARFEAQVARGLLLIKIALSKEPLDGTSRPGEHAAEWSRLEKLFDRDRDSIKSGLCVLSAIDQLRDQIPEQAQAIDELFKETSDRTARGLVNLWLGKKPDKNGRAVRAYEWLSDKYPHLAAELPPETIAAVQQAAKVTPAITNEPAEVVKETPPPEPKLKPLPVVEANEDLSDDAQEFADHLKSCGDNLARRGLLTPNARKWINRGHEINEH